MTLFSRVLLHNQDKEKYPPSSVLNLLSPTLLNASANSIPSADSFKLILKLESSPVILYGDPSESTGFIILGVLKLDVSKEFEELQTVTLSLVQTFKYSRTFCLPSVSGCKNCKERKTTLARWDVLTDTASFPQGVHGYPFSHLLPGSLPPTSKLGSSHSDAFIRYDLIAVATVPHSTAQTTIRLPLHVSRLVLRGPDRNSLRVFPPTEVSASAVLPNVVYPKSTFPIELKLDNIVSNLSERRWRMRKLAWRIDETTLVRAHACPKHLSKVKHAEESHKRSPSTTPKGSSNMHHSTIHKNMHMLANASQHYHNSRSAIPQGHTEQNVDTTLEDDEVNDMRGRNDTAPTRALENFANDFGTGDPLVPLVSASAGGSVAPIRPAQRTPEATPEEPQAPQEHLYIEEVRTVSHGEVKSGWKSDFSGRGHIEMVAEISAANFSTGLNKHIALKSSTDKDLDDGNLRNGANVACDIDDSTLGVFVSHTLIVEMVVAEELIHAVKKKTKTDNSLAPVNSAGGGAGSPEVNTSASTGVPTGAARVLRMQFKVVLTERSGLGIAWDDEVPPTYEDVRTLSPPTYQETSATATPVLTPLLSGSLASPSIRQTPRVLHGVGNTPGLTPTPSISQTLDIQELML